MQLFVRDKFVGATGWLRAVPRILLGSAQSAAGAESADAFSHSAAPDEDFQHWSGHLSHRFLQICRLPVAVSTNSGTNVRAMYG